MDKVKGLCTIRRHAMLHQAHISVIRSLFGLAMLGTYSDENRGKDDTSTNFPVARRIVREDDHIESLIGGLVPVWPDSYIGFRHLRDLMNRSARGHGFRVCMGMHVTNNRLFNDVRVCMADPEYMSDVCGYGPTDIEQVVLIKCLGGTALSKVGEPAKHWLHMELRINTAI